MRKCSNQRLGGLQVLKSHFGSAQVEVWRYANVMKVKYHGIFVGGGLGNRRSPLNCVSKNYRFQFKLERFDVTQSQLTTGIFWRYDYLRG